MTPINSLDYFLLEPWSYGVDPRGCSTDVFYEIRADLDDLIGYLPYTMRRLM